MPITVTARVTVYPGGWNKEAHHANIDRFLAEILPVSGRLFAPADAKCSAVSLFIRHIPTFGGEVELDETESLIFRITPVAFLEFTAQVEVNEEAVFTGFWVPEHNRPHQLEFVARRRVDEAIANLAFAICLSAPFAVRFGEPHFLPENEPVPASAVNWSEVGRGAPAKEIGWPTLQELPLVDVLMWLDRLPGYRDGVGRGPVGRAVAALSQALASGRGTPPALVWSMVGLEALYCRTADGLKRQLSTHSQLLLGPIEAHKKRFGKLYDYRSEFLHGSMDIPFAHRDRDSDDDVWQFIWRSDDEAGLAGVVLLASVQELIHRGWQSLEFTTALVGSYADLPDSN